MNGILTFSNLGISTFPASDLGEDCLLPELFPLIFTSFLLSGDVSGDFLCKKTYLCSQAANVLSSQ